MRLCRQDVGIGTFYLYFSAITPDGKKTANKIQTIYEVNLHQVLVTRSQHIALSIFNIRNRVRKRLPGKRFLFSIGFHLAMESRYLSHIYSYQQASIVGISSMTNLFITD